MKLNKSMLTVLTLTVVLVMVFVISGCQVIGGSGSGGSDSEPGISQIDWDNHEERAEQFVMALVNGDYSVAAAGFDRTMRLALGTRGLKKAWEDTVIAEAGAFAAIAGTEIIPHDEYEIYEVSSRHENLGVTSRVVFSSGGLVSGLFFNFFDADNAAAPGGTDTGTSSGAYSAEDYDMSPRRMDGYTDYPVIIGEGTDYPLKGMLSVPDGITGAAYSSLPRHQVRELLTLPAVPAGAKPAVVLVHGSGPHDMDETVFGITVFKDIAGYLANNGVAVLRYDKRTYAYGEKLMAQYGDELTVREETIDDAVLARDFLVADGRIDAERIYVAGHSLGGMLAPRIVSEGGFAGGIIMAGSPRSLLDIIYDQNMYFIGMMDIDEDERRDLYDMVEEAREDFFTLPEKYISEMDAYPSADFLTGTEKPFLIMQGAKDFQVYADVDFAMYQEIAAGRGNIEFRLYDDLGHLFTVSTMENPTTDDYIAGATVDTAPLADIAAWITER
jgi:dienelactone hydrolase